MSSAALSAENLGVYHAHPFALPDSEQVSQPVDVLIFVHRIAFKEYDDKNASATIDLGVWYTWCDPRLAGWQKGSEFPPDLWTPEFSIQGSIDGNQAGQSFEKPRNGINISYYLMLYHNISYYRRRLAGILQGWREGGAAGVADRRQVSQHARGSTSCRPVPACSMSAADASCAPGIS
eukprot:SAG31_NODE_5346_length_2594_cov_6.626052_3_plen_178_part_00